MKIRLYFLFVIAISILNNGALLAQEVWKKVNKEVYYLNENEILEKQNFPKQYDLLSFDSNIFSKKIKSAKKPLLLLPNSEGGFSRYQIVETSNLSSELSRKFPMIKSYTAYGVDNPTSIAKISIGTDGFHAVVFSPGKETLYVDPYSKDRKKYISYSRKDLSPENKQFACRVEQSEENRVQSSLFSRTSNNGVLRTFRLALACTGEYAQFHLTRQNVPNTATSEVKKAAVLSAMNTSITRVNGVFEKDLSVNLKIIDNNDQLIFLDPNTDNLTNSNEGVLINEIQSVIDSKVGNGSYDLGHVFSTGDNAGIAVFRSACSSSSKAQGVTGRTSPIGDAYDIDFVIHELGHQFGANHTFNNSCGDNRESSTAVEPGSGSTIMGYAGICNPNVQSGSDDHFHSISVTEMLNFIQTSATCYTTTNTGNSAPTANAGLDYSIPKSTPFILRGSATDADGTSGLTYNWEQIDTQIATMPPLETSIGGPMFRSFASQTTPNRYMPALNTVIGGSTSSTWEVVPSIARDMNFSFLVRDNHVGGGSVARDDMKVTVVDANPFTVTAPNIPVSWDVGTSQTISWNKGTTDTAPINCNNVNIKMSTDGGMTFPITLKANTPNDGSENVLIPNTPSTQVRIMVEAADNIFYNVNTVNITINSSEPTFLLVENSGTQYACNTGNEKATYSLNFDFINGFSETVTLSATGHPNGVNVTFNPSTISSDGNVTMEVSNFNGQSPQAYIINVLASANSLSRSINLGFNLTSSTFTQVKLTAPVNGAQNVNLSTEFNWEADSNASSYDIQVASDSGFSTILISTNVTTNSYKASGLSGNTTYYWRVKPKNSCGEGTFSNVFSYKTLTPSYCVSTFTDEAGGSEHITNVTFNTINNDSGNDTVDGYQDFSSITTNVKRGDAHQVSVTFNTGGYQDHCYVFIDWNQDYIFDKDEERYDLGSRFDKDGNTSTTDESTITFSINVPNDAAFGRTRMRVVVEYDDPTDNFGDGPCDADHLTEWGETEDYSIIVDNTASIEDVVFQGFNLFPNPTKGEFTLNLKVINTDKVSVQLFDVRGRLIDEKNYVNTVTNFSKKIFFQKASSGLYLLKVINGNKQTTRKLIID